MRTRLELVRLVAFAALGVALIIGSGIGYQASVSSARSHNASCPPDVLCSTAVPNPIWLIFEATGWGLVLIAVVVLAYDRYSRRRVRAAPP